jgi:uridine kinase
MESRKRCVVVFLCGLGGSGNSVVVELDWYATHSTQDRKKRIEDARKTGDKKLLEKEENPKNWYSWSRFKRDLSKLKAKRHLNVRGAWNQKTGKKDLSVDLRLAQGGRAIILCEGIYLLHDTISKFADYIIYLTVSERLAHGRSAKRDLHRSSKQYLAYKRYLLKKYDVPYFAENEKNAHLVLATDSADPRKIAERILRSTERE